MPEDVWSDCAHIVSETFQTQRVDHAFLEPESTLATLTPDGHLYVYSGGQGIWDDRNDISRVLNIGTDDVTVELISMVGPSVVKRICLIRHRQRWQHGY